MRILIKNADWIITMDAARRRLKNACLIIHDNVIEDIFEMTSRPLPHDDAFDSVIDASGHLIIPGLINTHLHCDQTLLQHIPALYDNNLYDSLRLLYHALTHLTENDMYYATMGALGSLLKSGCTTSIDHSYVQTAANGNIFESQVRAAAKVGIRFHLIRGCITQKVPTKYNHIPEALVEPGKRIFAETRRLIETFHDIAPYAMLRVGIGPNWLLYENEQILVELQRLATAYQVSLHSHLADSREEFLYAKEIHNCTPIEYANRLGLLNERNFFAHCSQITKNDYACMARSGAGISYLPVSDMNYRTGLLKMSELKRRKIKTGLGVDGAAGCGSSNMLFQMRTAYFLQKDIEIQRHHELIKQNKAITAVDHITPEDILYTATAGGAKLLGRSDIGHLATGMAADLVLCRWNQFQFAGGLNDPISAIVLSGDSSLINTVFVNGQKVVENGRLSNIDEEACAADINMCAKRIMEKSL